MNLSSRSLKTVWAHKVVRVMFCCVFGWLVYGVVVRAVEATPTYVSCILMCLLFCVWIRRWRRSRDDLVCAFLDVSDEHQLAAVHQTFQWQFTSHRHHLDYYYWTFPGRVLQRSWLYCIVDAEPLFDNGPSSCWRRTCVRPWHDILFCYLLCFFTMVTGWPWHWVTVTVMRCPEWCQGWHECE